MNKELSNDGYKMICSFEGIRHEAYLDSVGIPTIGIGFIRVNGIKVKLGDYLNDDQIELQFFQQIKSYETAVNTLVKKPLTQSQFDSLVSFAFNLGINALGSSTLLKKININPNDTTIGIEFEKWCKAGGKVIQGLLVRRKNEYKNYIS